EAWLGLLGAADGDEEDGLPTGDEHRAAGLLGDAARLEDDGLVPDLDGFSDDHASLHAASCGARRPRGSAQWLGDPALSAAGAGLGPRFEGSSYARALESKSERSTVRREDGAP